MFPKRNNPSAGIWSAPRSAGNTMTFDTMNIGYASNDRMQMIANEMSALKQENVNLQQMLFEAQTGRDKLRATTQKLKVENGRLKLKIKRVADAANQGKGVNVEALLATDDGYENIGTFILIGGPKDPLDIQYPTPVKDRQGRQFKNGERYLWCKMAEHFGDTESAVRFLSEQDDKKAQDLVEKVKSFDQDKWDAVKMTHFEEYQRLKFEQNRPLRCLLLKTAPLYLAVASQDKTYGTGWRKARVEADRPKYWDGENMGGKLLMKLRDEFTANHSWVSSTEEEDAKKLFEENKRTIWKKIRPSSDRQGGGRGGGQGGNAGRKREGAGRGRGSGRGGAGTGGGSRGRSIPSLYGSRTGGAGDLFGAASYFGGDGYTSFSSAASSFGLSPMTMRNGGPPFKRRR